MKALVAPLALIALILPATPALAAKPQPQKKPSLSLLLKTDGKKTSVNASLAVPKTDLFGLLMLQNSLVRVLNSGKIITLATTVNFGGNQVGVKVLIRDGTAQIGLTTNPPPLRPSR